MTYREYIETMAQRFNLSDGDVNLMLANQSAIIPDPDADVDVKIAKTALCNEFALLIPLQSSISEGGLSVSISLDAVKLWYSTTCAELGITDRFSQPKIRNRSNIW